MGNKKYLKLLLVTPLLLTGCSNQPTNNSPTSDTDTSTAKTDNISLIVPVKEYKDKSEITELMQDFSFKLNSQLVINYIPYTQEELDKIAEVNGVLAIEPTAYSLDYLRTNNEYAHAHDLVYPSVYKYTMSNDLGYSEQYLDEQTVLGYNEEILRVVYEDKKVYELPVHHPFIATDVSMLKDGYLEETSEFDVNVNVNYRQIYPFHVVGNWEDIPLSAGEYPSNEKEVVISDTAAQLIKSLYDLSSDDELIGMELPLGVFTAQSLSFINEITTYTGPAFDVYNYGIKGIATVNDNDEAIVFFNEGVDNIEMIDTYVTNKDNLTYDSLRILLNPSANPTKVLDEINAIIGDDGNAFTIQ